MPSRYEGCPLSALGYRPDSIAKLSGRQLIAKADSQSPNKDVHQKHRTPLWLRCAGMLSARRSRLDEHARLPGAVLRPSVDPIVDSPTPRIYHVLARVHPDPALHSRSLQSHDAAQPAPRRRHSARVAHHMGHECVRGSTFAAAPRRCIELHDCGRHMNWPSRPMDRAGRAGNWRRDLCSWRRGWGCPSCAWDWVTIALCMPTWDRFAIPRPVQPCTGGDRSRSPCAAGPGSRRAGASSPGRRATTQRANQRGRVVGRHRRAPRGFRCAFRQGRILGAGSMFGEVGVGRLAAVPAPPSDDLPLFNQPETHPIKPLSAPRPPRRLSA